MIEMALVTIFANDGLHQDVEMDCYAEQTEQHVENGADSKVHSAVFPRRCRVGCRYGYRLIRLYTRMLAGTAYYDLVHLLWSKKVKFFKLKSRHN